MVSLLAVRQILDNLDGHDTESNMIHLVTNVLKWKSHSVGHNSSSGAVSISWHGECSGMTARFTYRQEGGPKTEQPQITYRNRSSLEVTSDEYGEAQSVIRCQRGDGWESFGVSTIRLSFQDKKGEWRYNVLGYPHPISLSGWAGAFADWYMSGAEYDPKLGIMSKLGRGGAVRSALHLLETAVTPDFMLGKIPSLPEAELALSRAIHNGWRRNLGAPYWKKK